MSTCLLPQTTAQDGKHAGEATAGGDSSKVGAAAAAAPDAAKQADAAQADKVWAVCSQLFAAVGVAIWQAAGGVLDPRASKLTSTQSPTQSCQRTCDLFVFALLIGGTAYCCPAGTC